MIVMMNLMFSTFFALLIFYHREGFKAHWSLLKMSHHLHVFFQDLGQGGGKMAICDLVGGGGGGGHGSLNIHST